MGEIFGWWLAVELLGIAALPLAAVLFRHLPDRGWALAKPLGLLAVGWLVWFPLSVVAALPYSRAWIAGTIVVFLLANLALLRLDDVRAALMGMLARERVYIVLVEVVFTGAFALMAWIRSFTPAVVDQEKFMDVAFLSGIWRAPHLPPPDPWLSGEPINYYYFGHYLLATLAKLLGTVPAIAFNIGIALIFALTAVAVFGVATNLLAAIGRPASGRLPEDVRGTSVAPTRLGLAPVAGLVSVLLVLILGNLNGVQVAWQQAVSLSTGAAAPLPNPWALFTHREFWLDYNWWSPSRVVQPSNTINEFPAFSFILADLHAHVLALPFAALALALALSFVLARGEGLRVYGTRITGPVTLGGAAVVLGALYALNGWDLPTYLALALLALVIQQWLAHARRIDSVLLLDLFAVGAVLVALAVLLYLPFYRSFVSPSQGVGLVPGYARSPISQEFAIYGLPLAVAGSYLVWRLASWAGAALAAAEADGRLAPPSSGFLAQVTEPRTLGALIVGLAAATLALLTLSANGWLDWTLLWSALVIGACTALALRLLGARWGLRPRASTTHGEAADKEAGKPGLASTGLASTGAAIAEDIGAQQAAPGDHFPATLLSHFRGGAGGEVGKELGSAAPAGPGERIADRAEAWLLCLVGTAAALVAACELVFLRDVFAVGANGQLGDLFRMNTVFKLYYQAWLIGGIACGPALVLLVRAAWGYVAPLVLSRAPRLVPVAAVDSSPQAAQTAEVAASALAQSACGEQASGELPEALDGGGPRFAHTPVMERTGVEAPQFSRATAVSKQTHHRVRPLRYVGAGGIVVWMALLVMLVAAALVYPVMASAARTQNYTLPRSLDGAAFMTNDATNAGDADAIAWLNAHEDGDQVIVEAAKYDEYTHLGRVSAFTGLPTLLGWGGHELQWRINWLSAPAKGDVLGQRLDAVTQIYTNPDKATVKRLLQQYSVRLIYVGAAERQTYPSANLDRFTTFLPVVYSREGVTIYAVPGGK